ncbi:cytochrome P450 6B2-like [Colias croceus]|uniref:cytochrome P450 6B2-like n=1 Tax=Colias crocea TaxID=72248 RepID=UPI001E27C82A|nr:cytochrome P450 6B2-like [Colias croceus]
MFLILILLGILVLYYYSVKNFSYFSKRNIKHDPPIPIFGNYLSVAFARFTDIEMATYLYNKYDGEKVVGYYRGTTPELVVRDPELLKHILNLDFLHFYKRGLGRDPKLEPLLRNLVSSEGDTWKLLRKGLSPAFTSSKLKNMFPIINECTDRMVNLARKMALTEEEFDACNLSARFTMELIGAHGFGIDMNTINNEHSLFINLREFIFIKSKWQIFLFAIKDLFPNSLIKKVVLGKPQIAQTLTEILNGVRKQRQNDKNPRHDFIHLLLELEKEGKIYSDSLEPDENGQFRKIELDFDETYVIAQLYVYLAAGFETASTAMSYTMHELAFHPEIQREVQEEVDRVLDKYDNKLCSEAISEMVLLEMCVKEGLRIFPPAGALFRVCTKNFRIPESNVTIEAGTKLIVPVQGLHMDPKYFENPKEFRPKRFLTEAKTWPKYAYIPFGEGPKKCIGARMGTIEAMCGLAALLHKFNIEPSPSSTKELKVNRASFIVQCIDNGLPMQLSFRNKPL